MLVGHFQQEPTARGAEHVNDHQNSKEAMGEIEQKVGGRAFETAEAARLFERFRGSEV